MVLCAANSTWLTTGLMEFGYVPIPMLRIASTGLGGFRISVNLDNSWNICLQKLVRLGHSQRVCNRLPICQQLGNRFGKNLAILNCVSNGQFLCVASFTYA